jgi:hypothetical protein
MGRFRTETFELALNIAAGSPSRLILKVPEKKGRKILDPKAELNWYRLQSDPMTAAVPVLFFHQLGRMRGRSVPSGDGSVFEDANPVRHGGYWATFVSPCGTNFL